MGAETSSLMSGAGEPVASFPDYSLYTPDPGEDGEEDKTSTFATSRYKPGCSLEKLADKLKQYRHPSILRFAAWRAGGGGAALDTEWVLPLARAGAGAGAERALCLGLMEVCRALSFLHQAGLTHGNLTRAAVFVTATHRWRLGALDTAAPATETGLAKDIQAFGLMVTEILADCELEASVKFRDFAKNNLLLPDVRRLPSAENILQDPYFNQSFAKIFQFLVNFPVQSPEEKVDFFKTATARLQQLPPELVASHLVPLLLSRYVMMDPEAKQFLVPNLLVPRCPASAPPAGLSPILPAALYADHLVPQLRVLFSVPDTNIR